MTELQHSRPTEDLAHLAWCILTAVGLARLEGKSVTSLQTHMFIMQWLGIAQKRKLFPRILASDIIWLQEQGRKYGAKARLYAKVEYIWLASSGELAKQSTLFRFTYMIDTLRTMGWQDYLLDEQEWEAATNETAINTIYTPKQGLHASFSDDGELTVPLPLKLSGEIGGIFPLISQCGLNVEHLPEKDGFSFLRLLPKSL